MIASKKILHEQKMAELDNSLEMESEAQVAMRQNCRPYRRYSRICREKKTSIYR